MRKKYAGLCEPGVRCLPARCRFPCHYSGVYTSEARRTIKANPKESHLRNIRQLTHGGTNAEAYFSADGKRLIFQSTRDPYKCDQIFTMNLGSDRTCDESVRAKAEPPAHISLRMESASSTLRRTWVLRIARRQRIDRQDMSGRSIKTSTSSRPIPMAPT